MGGPQVDTGAPAPDPAADGDEEFVMDMLEPEDEVEGGEPGAPKPPDSEAAPAAPKEVAPAKAPGDQAQPRDERGRFAETGEPAPGPAAPKAAPEAAAPPAAPTTEAASAAAAAAAAEQPFTFQAEGKPWKIEGSRVAPDGSVTIPKDRLPQLQEVLAEGVHHRLGWRQEREAYERRVAEADQKSVYAVERSNHVLDHLEALVEAHRAGQADKDGVSPLQAFLENLATEWPRLKLEAQTKAHEIERQQFLSARSSEDRAAEDSQLERALGQHVQEIAAKYPGIEAQRIFQRLRPRMRTVFFRADRDVPEAGLKKGEIGVYLAQIEDEFRTADEYLKAGLRAAQAASAQEKKNAAAVASSAAPPAVPAAAAPAPGGRTKALAIPKFKTREERDAWLNGGYKKDLGEA